MHEPTHADAQRRLPGRDAWFALAVTAAFLIYAGITTGHHEMWRDEMGPWLIGRDSRSLLDVFHNIRYDGHPSLWYLLVWGLTSVTGNPEAMQWLNLAIAAGAVYLIALAAPAPRWLRLGAALGYYPVYEYGSIARNYALGLLFLVAFCVLFPKRREHPWLAGLLLLLLANTSMLACLLAMALLATLVLDALQKPSGEPERKTAWGALALAAAGIAFSIWQVIPPPDSGYAMGWHFGFEPQRLVEVLKNLTAAYLPLPRPGAVFWETQFLTRLPLFRDFSWLLAPLFLVLGAAALVRRPLALFYFLAGSFGLLAFFYAKHVGYLRHHGFLFLTLGSALWLARALPAARPSGLPEETARRLERIGAALFTLLVAVQLVGAAVAASGEYRYAFSGAKETAELIRSRGLERLPLVADIDISGMPVVGYLRKDKAYYPCGDRWGSFVVWDTARMQHSIVWEVAPLLAQKAGSPLVVVADDFVMKKFPPPAELAPKLKLIGSPKGEIATEESYSVYLLEK